MPDNLLARIGVLTISDRASRGEYKDVVAQALTEMSDREGCDLVLNHRRHRAAAARSDPGSNADGHHARTGRI